MGRLAITVVLLVLAGCSYSASVLKLATTQELPAARAEVVRVRVSARSCQFEWYLGQFPTIGALVDEALAQAPGANALVDVTIGTTTYPFSWLIVLPDRHCVDLYGDAVRIRGE